MDRLFLLAFILLVSFSVCEGKKGKYGKWGYSLNGQYGPKNWGNIRGGSSCLGANQSPIDINTMETIEQEFRPFKFVGYDSNGMAGSARPRQMSNNGKTVKISLEGDYFLTGGGLPSRYKAAQMHFHWGADWTKGSEHTINGQSFQGEFHIVHYDSIKYRNIGAALKQPDGLAVLGFWLKSGAQYLKNQNWDEIIRPLSSVRYVGTAYDFTQNPFRLDSLLPPKNKLRKFYRYQGSLTTPGCYESVLWTVFHDPIELSEAQMLKFRTLTSLKAPPSAMRQRGGGGADREEDLILDNFRPIQPHNYRRVVQSFEHQEGSEYESDFESPESSMQFGNYGAGGTGTGAGAGTGAGGTGGTGAWGGAGGTGGTGAWGGAGGTGGTGAWGGAGGGTGVAGNGNVAGAGAGGAGNNYGGAFSDVMYDMYGPGPGGLSRNHGGGNQGGNQGGQPDMTGQTNNNGQGQGGQANNNPGMTGQTNYYGQQQGGNSGPDTSGQTNYYGQGQGGQTNYNNYGQGQGGQVNNGPDMTGQTNYYGQGGNSGQGLAGQADYYGQGGQVNNGQTNYYGQGGNSGQGLAGQADYYGQGGQATGQTNNNGNDNTGQVNINPIVNKPASQGGATGGTQGGQGGGGGGGGGQPTDPYGGYGGGYEYGGTGGGYEYGAYGGNNPAADPVYPDYPTQIPDVTALPSAEPFWPGSQPGVGGSRPSVGGSPGVGGSQPGVGGAVPGAGGTAFPQLVNTNQNGAQAPDPYTAGHQSLKSLAQMWQQLLNGQKTNPDDAAYYDANFNAAELNANDVPGNVNTVDNNYNYGTGVNANAEPENFNAAENNYDYGNAYNANNGMDNPYFT